MKITDLGNRTSPISSVPVRDDRRVDINSEKPNFGDTLRKSEEADIQTRINRLMSEIEKQGETLAKNMDIKELRNYKKLIQEFMDEVVNGALSYSKHSHFDRRGRHKVYAMVKKVNAKVEELSREFLKEEKDNIGILESIGTIKGMLMDMYM